MSSLVEQILQALTAGLLMGCIYGLMCVGLGLIFGIMRVINFAQGDFLMVGMYLAIFFAGSILPAAVFGAAIPFIAALLTGPVMFVAGYLLNRHLVSRTTGLQVIGSAEGEAHQTQLILTLGVALVLENSALLFLGSAPMTALNKWSAAAWELPLRYDDFSAVFVNKARFINALIAIAVTIALFAFTARTRLGKSLRAAAINPEAALYMGIDVSRAHHIAFGLGTAIAAISGGLVAVYYPAQPFVGLEFLIIIYAGVVLGGLGNIMGAFWGGMTIGLVQQLSTIVIPLQLQNAAIFVVFITILLFRPEGLFGKSAERA